MAAKGIPSFYERRRLRDEPIGSTAFIGRCPGDARAAHRGRVRDRTLRKWRPRRAYSEQKVRLPPLASSNLLNVYIYSTNHLIGRSITSRGQSAFHYVHYDIEFRLKVFGNP